MEAPFSLARCHCRRPVSNQHSDSQVEPAVAAFWAKVEAARSALSGYQPTEGETAAKMRKALSQAKDHLAFHYGEFHPLVRECGAALAEFPVAATEAATPPPMGGEPVAVTDEMVNRFLAWRLPYTFCPDGGVNFDGRGRYAAGYEKSWPVGTNLFTAVEARQMLEYALGVAK